MSLEYPQPLAAPYGPFPSIADLNDPQELDRVRPQRRMAVVHLGSGGSLAPTHLRRAPSGAVGVLELHVSVGGDHSNSFVDGVGRPRPAEIVTCAFCQGVDDIVVSWKIQNAEFAHSAFLTVRAARLDGTLSRVNVTDLLTNGRGVSEGATGGLPLAEALRIEGEHAHLFPDGVLTAEYSPYRFELQLVAQRGSGRNVFPSRAWTFGQVLVHSIDLAWGGAGSVKTAPQPGVVDPLADGRFRGLEEALVRDLLDHRDLHADTIDLVLDTNAFSAVHIDADGAVKSPFQSSVDAFRKAWGDGPRIPLEATVYARAHDGSRASLIVSQRTVGRVQLLWDWEDDAARLDLWSPGARAGLSYVNREGLRRLLSEQPIASPPGSQNCPAEFGGKRGTTANPVFMLEDNEREFGNTVELAGGDRPWCSVTRTGSGLRRARSLVYFQPPPIAGDRYKVAVYLTHADADPRPDDKPNVNVVDDPPVPERPGEGDAPPVPGRAARPLRSKWRALDEAVRPRRADTGTFVVKRRARVRLAEWPAGGTAAARAAVADYYRDFADFILDIDAVTLPDTTLGHALREWRTTNGANGTVIEEWCIRADAPGAHAVSTLSYAEFDARVVRHMDYAKLYVSTRREDRGIGSNVSTAHGGVFVWGISRPNEPAWTVYASINENVDLVAADAGNPPGWKRACFTGLSTRSVVDPLVPARTLVVDFVAGGQTRSSTVTWSRLRLGKPSLSTSERRDLRTKIDALVVALGAGPFSVPIEARMRVREVDVDVQLWLTVVRDAARAAYEEGYAAIPPDLAGQFFRGPWKGKPDPLSQGVYEDAVRRAVKGVLVPMANRLRLNEQRDFPGLLYLCLTSAANVGNFGIGGNNTGGRMGVGYVTEFPTAGFSQQLMMSLTDVMGHEFGHAFWLNHAPSLSFSFIAFEKEVNHANHDTCLMNYDLDPHSQNFCAHCMLSLRGWTSLTQPLSLDEAGALLDREIAAEGAAMTRAWKRLRRARLHLGRQGERTPDQKLLHDSREASEAAWNLSPRDRPTATTRASDGRAAMGRVSAALTAAREEVRLAEADANDLFDDPAGVALLRALVRARLSTSDYGDAWRLWQRLRGVTTLGPDLRDAVSVNDTMLPGVATTLEVSEGGNHLAAAVTQYLNLPREARFAGGARVAHVDRLGRRVRLRVTTTGAIKRLSWALLRHRDDGGPPHETVVPEPFGSADPEYNAAVWLKEALAGTQGSGLTRVDDTHFTLEFELPDRAARYKVAVAGAPRCVLSPVISARLAMFVMTTATAGDAAANATPDAALTDALNAAYEPIGVEFVHIGRETFGWPGGAYADDMDANAKAVPFVGAAHALRTRPARSPFAPGLASYEDHYPYLVNTIFVKTLARWAGQKMHAQPVNTTRDTPVITLNVVGKGSMRAQLWSGNPADVSPDARGLAATYVGRGTDKPWLVSATFTPTGGIAAPVPPDQITGAESDHDNYPGRLDRLNVDLTTLAADNGSLVGQLQVVVVSASFVAGVDASPFAPVKGMTILVTENSASGAPSSSPAQHSAAAHEVGHMLGLVAADAHPARYDIGTGPHCHAGIVAFVGNGMGEAYYPGQINNATCVMYHRVRAGNPLLAFCADCVAQAQATRWRKFV